MARFKLSCEPGAIGSESARADETSALSKISIAQAARTEPNPRSARKLAIDPFASQNLVFGHRIGGWRSFVLVRELISDHLPRGKSRVQVSDHEFIPAQTRGNFHVVAIVDSGSHRRFNQTT